VEVVEVTGVVPVVVAWVVVVVVVVAVVVGVLVVVGVEVVVTVFVVCAVVAWHCWTASWLTVVAPSTRFWRTVLSIVSGRLETSTTSCLAALPAAPQRPALSAFDTAFSWLFRLLAWSPDRSPAVLPPHAATAQATAKPSPPARSAR
jgi:hypothetical protein